jgi:hypothetical protein
MPLTLLTTETITSSECEVDFTSKITDAYDEYQWHCYNIHPSGLYHFQFQVDVGTATTFGQNMTTSRFEARHEEAEASSGVSYNATFDQQNSDQVFQNLADYIGGSTTVENAASASGVLTIFDPATDASANPPGYVKQFIARFSNAYQEDYMFDHYTSGFINTTTAITRIRFQMSSGTIDTGVIKMFGVS